MVMMDDVSVLGLLSISIEKGLAYGAYLGAGEDSSTALLTRSWRDFDMEWSLNEPFDFSTLLLLLVKLSECD
jgi:hypothetical protein